MRLHGVFIKDTYTTLTNCTDYSILCIKNHKGLHITKVLRHSDYDILIKKQDFIVFSLNRPTGPIQS